MSTFSFKCPNCNGISIIPVESDHFICSYCESRFLNKEINRKNSNEADNKKYRNMGYQFERGKTDAINEGAEEDLINRVEELLYKKQEIQQLEDELSKIEEKVKTYRHEINNINALSNSIRFYSPLIVVVFLVLFGGSFRMPSTLVIPLILIGICSIPFGTVNRKKELAKKVELYNKWNFDRNELEDRIFEIEDSLDNNLIPEDYCDYTSLKFIHNVLSNKRAMDIQQAINMYEDKKHKDKILQIKNEELNIQRQQYNLHQQQLKMQEEQIRAQREQIRVQQEQAKYQKMQYEEQVSNNSKTDKNNSIDTIIAFTSLASLGLSAYRTFKKRK